MSRLGKHIFFEALQVGACLADCGTPSFSKAFAGVSNPNRAISERLGVHRPFTATRLFFDFLHETRKL
jgi:hypothetical protein